MVDSRPSLVMVPAPLPTPRKGKVCTPNFSSMVGKAEEKLRARLSAFVRCKARARKPLKYHSYNRLLRPTIYLFYCSDWHKKLAGLSVNIWWRSSQRTFDLLYGTNSSTTFFRPSSVYQKLVCRWRNTCLMWPKTAIAALCFACYTVANAAFKGHYLPVLCELNLKVAPLTVLAERC